ncbi:MAG: lipopolysaccharide heptosyltransferase II [Phycisphaerae bacterium]
MAPADPAIARPDDDQRTDRVRPDAERKRCLRRLDTPPPPARILVALPNWVGDVVLATPMLAALRAHFRDTRMTFLLRGPLKDVVAGGGWHDELIPWPATRGVAGVRGVFALASRLRSERFDLAILFTNSFRSALVTWLAGIPRRVGYAREARGWMLTERLRPVKRHGEFVPRPMAEYYSRLCERVECPVADFKLRLGITPADEQAGRALQAHYGLAPRARTAPTAAQMDGAGGGAPYAVFNVGAAFGAAKCWLPERFAETCDRVQRERGWRGVLVGAPNEFPLMRRIVALAETPVVCCDNPPTTLGSLKVLVRDAELLVCNDTGPRHYGNAFDVPTVTIFGPTHQEWTDTGYRGEMKLQARVECGPCQLPRCPLDHRCMQRVSSDMVMHAARRLTAIDGEPQPPDAGAAERRTGPAEPAACS